MRDYNSQRWLSAIDDFDAEDSSELVDEQDLTSHNRLLLRPSVGAELYAEIKRHRSPPSTTLELCSVCFIMQMKQSETLK